MKKAIKCFLLGVISTVIVIILWGWQKNGPSNAVREFSPETQQMMLQLMPWLETAKGVNVGPFNVVVPSDNSATPEAIIYPQENGFPQVFLLGRDEISLVGGNGKIMSVRFVPETGELESYNFSPDASYSTTFFDSDFDGQFDLKILPADKGQKPNIQVHYQSKWLPTLFNDNKKHIEVDGQLREITIENSGWSFVN